MPDGWTQTNFYKRLGDGTLDYVIHHQPPGHAADIWDAGNVRMSPVLEFIPGMDAEVSSEHYYNAKRAHDEQPEIWLTGAGARRRNCV
jgi:hypothetical protein